MTIFHWIIILCLVLCKLTRCIMLNILNIIYYACRDAYEYIKYQKWKEFKEYGIDMFIGMFGHGKTLTMTHRAEQLYKKHGESLRFISNYKLENIPYTSLENFNQIVKLGKEAVEKKPKYLLEGERPPMYYYDENGHIKKQYRRKVKVGKDEDGNPIYERKILRPPVIGTVVLIDEIENVLSHREYAKFPMPMLSTLTQQRKAKIYIMCSAQRFFMVDKLFRGITTHAIDCNKYWRFQHAVYYDAWDYEQAMNEQLLKREKHKWWFIKDKDFNAYDTTQMINEEMCKNFISNDEVLMRKGLDDTVNEGAVRNPSRRLKKARKVSGKK